VRNWALTTTQNLTDCCIGKSCISIILRYKFNALQTRPIVEGHKHISCLIKTLRYFNRYIETFVPKLLFQFLYQAYLAQQYISSLLPNRRIHFKSNLFTMNFPKFLYISYSNKWPFSWRKMLFLFQKSARFWNKPSQNGHFNSFSTIF